MFAPPAQYGYLRFMTIFPTFAEDGAHRDD
jgi:hypothetical protein